MTLSSIIRLLGRSPLTTELLNKLQQYQCLGLNGASRLPKGLLTSTLAQQQEQNLLIVTATLEEAGRWAVQLEAIGWPKVHFYPTSEAFPYEPSNSEEMIWGQMQVLADLISENVPENVTSNGNSSNKAKMAVVATERSLQPHLPTVKKFQPYCLTLMASIASSSKTLGSTKISNTDIEINHSESDSLERPSLEEKLVQMGYELVPLVETEGQWSRRGDIIDVFPVASELPVRLEWFGDELRQIREFDPSTQRSLDKIAQIVLTPRDFSQWALGNLESITDSTFVSLLDYLPENTLIAIDEPDQCAAHGDRWFELVEENWQQLKRSQALPKIHRTFADSLAEAELFPRLYLSELTKETKSDITTSVPYTINLASRPLPVIPHQYAKLAENLRQQRERKHSVFLISAQPSRSVSLLQEHDCPAQFIPNSHDYPAIDKLQTQYTPVALKYSGLAELEGFILPTFRLSVITDREFYGQHTLATPTYIRKRRQATSKQVNPNKLQPGDHVVHRQHGIGKFVKLESLTLNNETRDYLTIQYADGLLRVAADQLSSLSRLRSNDHKKTQLNKLTGKTWESTKKKVRKSIKKLAVDLLKLYAQRAQQTGYSFPPDTPWQEEMEDSFPYQPTPDQLKATQDVKRDMESERAMDRLVCGDVGFGKTEVAIRAIFKAVIAEKQVAFLAPTTVLTQQHYHTLKERFAPYPIEIGLLNRFRTSNEKKEIQHRLATGELDIIVGTHSILSKTIQFRELGLLVVDEEQRFGVNQKEKIKALKAEVDVLTLTATPIPRTLYMALSGIREMSVITTPPPLRRPIKTHLAPYDLETARTAIRQELNRGGQVFYVVPRIEGIEELAGKLREMIPGARINIGHGKMDAAELESIMLTFSAGEADILVCTTIIESGLDIPRVNTILIEDAQKFGLSQLYQLRGRVGRAGVQAHAWLFYPTTSSGGIALTDDAQKRLRAIQEFTQLGSGYHLAMRDLEIRGAGDILGAEQSGQVNAIGFDLYTEMLEEAIREIKGQEIPQVDDTKIDLSLTAFIPADYILDLDQKISAYRSVAAANTREELSQIEVDWSDRYGAIPKAGLQLLRMMELKQVAKKIGFSRIKVEGKQHVILETPMEEPGWNLLKEKLPGHLQSRFVFSKGKVIVRGLGVLSADKQLESLIEWLSKMEGAIPKSQFREQGEGAS
ncbi:MAG: transcription-repair coupling factor [Trichodesmium sp. St16_bin4-tuft]|nr:transcription-repair coupling factor [Trichodesmium sp. St16_bin4-tuft]